MSSTDAVPLAASVDEVLGRLAAAADSKALAALDGATLLCERAMLSGMAIPERVSAGGGCRLFDARDDVIALNLSRPADRELLPALFEADELDCWDDAEIAARIAGSRADSLLTRGRTLGLALAAEHESLPAPLDTCVELSPGLPAARQVAQAPRVLDLSALWAGPLAAHLLWLGGAQVVKVESRSRPEAMRQSDPTFYTLLNQGKASVAVDLTNPSDLQALRSLIAASDIVIEAARPRGLAQLGIDAKQMVATVPGLVWVTITAHGAQGEAASWVGFGDDCGVAGGLSAELRAATGGRTGFVGDAIGDPLTGVHAALAAWQRWSSRVGGRIGLAMSGVVANCLRSARERDPTALDATLRAWSRAVGGRFPAVTRRALATLPAFGADTHSILAGSPSGQ